MNLAPWLRIVAISIAVAGIIDPVAVADRSVKRTVALVTAPGGTAADASTRSDIARRLSSSYRVVDRLMPDASATIVVGDRLPVSASAVSAPAFAVRSPSAGPSVSITVMDLPRQTPLASRVPVAVSVRAREASGQKVEISLRQGAATIDRVERAVASADETLNVTFDAIPSTRGPLTVTASARLVGDDVAAEADAATEVIARPWSVLFFDRRPSWASTFVRRALERDARFAVANRTITSTGIATERGDAPASLSREGLESYDAIVLGAPDSLSSGEVTALETFARQRGGAVVALLDQGGRAPLAQLTRVERWTASVSPAAVIVDTLLPEAGPLHASELLAVDQLPSGARVVAQASLAGTIRPVAIEVPVGVGRVIASGMVDAWRYRGVPGSSAFDRFWQTTIGAAAATAPPSIRIEPAALLVRSGLATDVRVTIRDIAGARPATGSAHVRGTISGPNASMASLPLRLWPADEPGRFVGVFRAPEAAGTYRIVVESGSDRGEAPIVVAASEVRMPKPDESAALAAWVHSRDGEIFAASDLPGLERTLSQTLHPEHRREPWWPMRSPWWMAAFAGVLGGEWWLRRRRDRR